MNTSLKIFAFVQSSVFAINATETVLIANDCPQNEFFFFDSDDFYDISIIYPKKDSYADAHVTIKILGTTNGEQTQVDPYTFSNLSEDDIEYSDSFRLSLKFEKSGNHSVRLPYDCTDIFRELPVSEIVLSGIDSSAYIENTSSMFSDCERLSSLDLSNLNTSKVADMSFMFNGCDKLKNINLKNLDTRNVTNMKGMFSQTGLEAVDLSHFDTKNVTDMSSMFLKCCELKTINLKNFNTSNVADMSEMFYSCKNLSSLDLISFDTRNVQKMDDMFVCDKSLRLTNLGEFSNNLLPEVIRAYSQF